MSDVSDEVEESSPAVEVPPIVTTIPTSPTNGRRKSGGRRKKHYLVGRSGTKLRLQH